MPQAMRVTEENLDRIVKIGLLEGMNLNHIHGEWELVTLCGRDLYVIMDSSNKTFNSTFTTMWDTDFFHYWTFTEAKPNDFAEITRI